MAAARNRGMLSREDVPAMDAVSSSRRWRGGRQLVPRDRRGNLVRRNARHLHAEESRGRRSSSGHDGSSARSDCGRRQSPVRAQRRRGANVRRRRAGARTLHGVRAAAAEGTASDPRRRWTRTRRCGRPDSPTTTARPKRRRRWRTRGSDRSAARAHSPSSRAGSCRTRSPPARPPMRSGSPRRPGVFRGNENGCLPAGLDGRDLLLVACRGWCPGGGHRRASLHASAPAR